MPRPRLPTKVLELRGSFKHDPQRREARAGEPEGVGDLGLVPAYLKDDQKQAWLEIASAAPWLTGSDRLLVESLALYVAQMRSQGNEFPASKQAAMTKLMTELGLTPASRSKVKVPAKAPASPFDKFRQ